jgi:hypothetical protein
MIVDSNKTKLPMAEVIKNAAQDMKSSYPANVVFVSIMKEATEPTATITQRGNTVFIVHNCKKRIAAFRALNCDTAENYLKASKVFAADMYKVGYDYMVTQFTDPTLLKIFKYVGKDKPKNMGYQVKKNKDTYTVTVKLGKPRTGEK